MYLKITFSLVLLLNLSHFPLFSQPVVEWSRKYGGGETDVSRSIQHTIDGGYIAAGYSKSNDQDVGGNNGNEDVWIIKLDEQGILQWEKNFGGTGEDKAWSIQQTDDGGYIAAGESDSVDKDINNNKGGADCWIIKLDEQGILQWEKTFGGSLDDKAYSIQQTKDGGYIVAGYSRSNNQDVNGNYGREDFWIFKLDGNGNLSWKKNFGGKSNDRANSIQQTTDGGYIIVGYSWSKDQDVSNNFGSSDIWVVKLDGNGNLSWEKNYGGSSNDRAYSIQQTSDQGYIIAGFSASNDHDVGDNFGALDFWIFKIDENGNLSWEKNFGEGSNDRAHAIHQTIDDGFVVAGSLSPGTSGSDFNTQIIKLDEGGNIQWEKKFNEGKRTIAYSIQQNPDGSLIVGGSSDSQSNGLEDFWIVKLGASCMDMDLSLTTNKSFLCEGDEVTLIANLTSISQDYEIKWYDHPSLSNPFAMGTNTITISPSHSQTYYAQATDSCIVDNLKKMVIDSIKVLLDEDIIKPSPDLDLDICFGDTIQLLRDIDFFIQPPSLDFSKIDMAFIPDGNSEYKDTISVKTIAPNQFLTSVDQIKSICITLEHSWVRDLEIILYSPNGDSVELHNFFSNIGPEVHLGDPIDNDGFEPTPGVGATYCWTPDATQGTMVDLANDNIHIIPFKLPPGNYSSLDPLENLLGSPINGDWIISVRDYWASDNGYVFGWSINFSDSLYTESNAIEGQWFFEDNALIANDSLLIAIPEFGQTEYTYSIATEEGRCNVDYTFQVNALPEPTLDLASINCGTAYYSVEFSTDASQVDLNAGTLVSTAPYIVTDIPIDVNLEIRLSKEACTTVTTITTCNPVATDNELDVSNFTLAPNPSKGYIHLSFNTQRQESLLLQTYDSFGQQVFVQRFHTHLGQNQRELWLSDLPVGVYFLRLQNEKGERLSRKVVVLR